jgi:hypothetical protein
MARNLIIESRLCFEGAKIIVLAARGRDSLDSGYKAPREIVVSMLPV